MTPQCPAFISIALISGVYRLCVVSLTERYLIDISEGIAKAIAARELLEILTELPQD